MFIFVPGMMHLRKYIKLFILLLLPVYLVLLGNSMSNMHLHVLSNGMVVKHAHPFDREEDSQEHHSHSDAETCYYQAFFLDYFDTAEPVHPLIADLSIAEILVQPAVLHYSFQHTNPNFLRGPPNS
ncbi:hypothetical protein [Sunxiuqinia dokdonensis]|uniref:DUF2946 domain-containing protein n=1 Tax=Sunxiuqinia dokdonensis TaxID=1409788 RepID=A0A0L8V4F3_9BACT|nr:hypothetical protein [Sunxiuqinia dokdonensis]KOH43304.1 hypothetical protein NC99_38640 [Sunxiuqinia dokdonensis]